MRILHLLLPAAFAIFVDAPYAQQTVKDLPIQGGTLTAGAIHSAKVAHDVVDPKDGKSVLLSADTMIDGGAVTKAIVKSGRISGTIPTTSYDIDTSSKATTLIAESAVSGLDLSSAELTSVVVTSPTVKGKEQNLKGQTIDLIEVDAKSVTFEAKTLKMSSQDLNKAPQATTTTEAANIPLAGDYFEFKTRVEGFAQSDDTGKKVAAPVGSCFRVTEDFPNPPGDKSAVPFVRGIFVTGYLPHMLLPPYFCMKKTELASDKSNEINSDLTYQIETQRILTQRDRLRYGWTWGVLVAPFKYYTANRTFSAGGTVGPYLGFRFRDRPGDTSTLAFGLGPTSATVTTNQANGSKSSSTTTGIAVALAYLADIKGQFNVGILAGTDLLSKDANVDTNRKLWLGVTLGVKLGN